MWISWVRPRHLLVASLYTVALTKASPEALRLGHLGVLVCAASTVCDYICPRVMTQMNCYTMLTLRAVPRIMTLCLYTHTAPIVEGIPGGGMLLWCAKAGTQFSFYYDLMFCFAMTTGGFTGLFLMRGGDHLVNRVQAMVDQLTALRAPPPVSAATLRSNATALTPEEAAAHNDVCSVCLTSVAPLRLECGHVFHAGCVEEWTTKKSAICPTCRAPIDKMEL